MKFYTKAELYEMPFNDYVWNVVDLDREAFRLGVRGMDRPQEIVRSMPRIYKVLELQERIARFLANLDAMKIVNASMMSLVEEG